MQMPFGHLTFCTNVFSGDTWELHYNALKKNVPSLKRQLSPEHAFGLGLRLSNEASLQLQGESNLWNFQQWLKRENCYVFAINGFPYGSFHHSRVKDKVHFPDWTTDDRLQYTLRLVHVLTNLVPEDIEGSISTSPISYKFWAATGQSKFVFAMATLNILEVVCKLFNVYKETGKVIHLDIEPEADGLIESSDEFLNWFQKDLIPVGITFLHKRLALSESESETAIRRYVRLCYDVCHFAVGFENVSSVLRKLKQADIKIGRWQLSSALKATLSTNELEKNKVLTEMEKFNESVYLHQVVSLQNDGTLLRFRDLPDIFWPGALGQSKELRSHFHVPLFISEYGLLQSTQEEVVNVLTLQKTNPVCNILEVETYTWDVLPPDLRLPIQESIIREMRWVESNLSD